MGEKTMEEKTEVAFEIDGNEIRLTPAIVQSFVASGDGKITLPEYKSFAEMCKVHRLNPFLKEIHLVKYGTSPATIIVSKDVAVKRAASHPSYNGKENGIIVQKENGEIQERAGNFLAPGEKLLGGWAKVYRKDWEHPEYVSVAYEDVAQRKKDGQMNTMWRVHGAMMCEKVAKSRALREAFVDEFGGLYDESEAGYVKNDDSAVDDASAKQITEMIKQKIGGADDDPDA